jgi:phosphatidylserine decarboxylase
MWLRFLPLRLISFCFGCFARLRGPRWLVRIILDVFIAIYRPNLSEAQKSYEQYLSLNDLFVRDLKAGARPIESELVSPVDGVLRSHGVIKDGLVEQVKGVSYELSELVGSKDVLQRLEGGHFFNLYLAPHNYHHIHAPLNLKLLSVKNISGQLYPVNNFALRTIEGLFAKNERVACSFESAGLFGVLVMVGALNVGSIQVHAKAGDQLEIGQKLGTFEMGSSVVLLLAKGDYQSKIKATYADSIMYGNSLIDNAV